jgi:hypothetical protein
MLRWTLRSGSAAIACEIDANPDGSFDLRVVPSLAPSSGFVERFSKVTFAMERHAEMASLLRDAGWVTTDRATTMTPLAA